MTVAMIVVISQDGFITKGIDPNPSTWSSPEDQAHYHTTLQNWPVLIMGSTTYRLTRSKLPEAALKIVLTREPGVVSDEKTRFMAGKPGDIVRELTSETGRALLLGGAVVFKDFLSAHMVDEILLTVEPLELQDGIRLFENWEREIAQLGFQEKSQQRLNETGTVLFTFVR